MTAAATLLMLGALSAAPRAVTVITPNGRRAIPIREAGRSGPLVPAAPLLQALGGTTSSDGVWLAVHLGPDPYRFLLDARLVMVGERLLPLAAPAQVIGDSLFLPLQFVSEALPRLQAARFSYDRGSARLTDRGPVVVTRQPEVPAAETTPAPSARRRTHRVTVDAGHGGVDPGNLGMYFPRGMREKDVNLAVSLLLQDELRSRGVAVTMTRAHDTLIDLRHRGRYCAEDCDLFVSIHVNSLPRRTGFTAVRGFETYFLAEARTEDAARVARMENEALRFDAQPADDLTLDGLDFIMRDLQINEYLRESARAAELVQAHLQKIHDGPDRGVRQAGLVVLNTARRPAILVELGYSTNQEDARLMSQRAGQRKLAAAIADAVMAYLAEYDRRSGDQSSAHTLSP